MAHADDARGNGMAHTGNHADHEACHGCQLFRRGLPGICHLDSNLTRFSPCGLWDAGVPYAMECQIAWTDVPVATAEPIRRSAYQKLTLVNGARFVARHLRTEAYPRPVYGWSIRNVTERTLLLFPGYADMNYLSQLEKLHGMQFNRPVVDDPAFPNTAHFVYLKNKKAFLFVASEDDNTARECCTKKTCVAGRQRKPIAEAAPSTYAPRQQNAAAPSVAIESSQSQGELSHLNVNGDSQFAASNIAATRQQLDLNASSLLPGVSFIAAMQYPAASASDSEDAQGHVLPRHPVQQRQFQSSFDHSGGEEKDFETVKFGAGEDLFSTFGCEANPSFPGEDFDDVVDEQHMLAELEQALQQTASPHGARGVVTGIFNCSRQEDRQPPPHPMCLTVLSDTDPGVASVETVSQEGGVWPTSPTSPSCDVFELLQPTPSLPLAEAFSVSENHQSPVPVIIPSQPCCKPSSILLNPAAGALLPPPSVTAGGRPEAGAATGTKRKRVLDVRNVFVELADNSRVSIQSIIHQIVSFRQINDHGSHPGGGGTAFSGSDSSGIGGEGFSPACSTSAAVVDHDRK